MGLNLQIGPVFRITQDATIGTQARIDASHS